MEERRLRPIIDYGDSERVDMRVARVISAPLAEGTNKPSRVLTLDGMTVLTSTENDQVEECLGFTDLYALVGPESRPGRCTSAPTPPL